MHPPKEYLVQFKVDYETLTGLKVYQLQCGEKSHNLAARTIVEQFLPELVKVSAEVPSLETELAALVRDLRRILHRFVALCLKLSAAGQPASASHSNGHAPRVIPRGPLASVPHRDSRKG